jgi:NADPH-dependent curcumin reductase CurA
MSNIMNRSIALKSRPSGAPTTDNFRLEERAMAAPAAGQVLLRTLYMSLDPYMRGRMNEGPSYTPQIEIDAVMGGGTVSRVEASQHADFKQGDLVLGYCGWQEYDLSDGTGLTKLNRDMAQPSLALGVLGMPGFTAYVGLLDIGQPKAGETVVVAAASGAVGALVGQIAKLKGCRIVGVAGGAEKCAYVVQELGFDVCLDHHAADFAQQLAAACPKGIDVYFESVGGAVFDAVLPLLNVAARIPLCGLISHYNDTALPPGPDRLPLLTRAILTKRVKIQGFIIFDHYETRHAEFFQQMSAWIAEGKIKFREDVVDGLEQAPQAFMGLLKGKNFGKLVVRLAKD